MKITGIVCEYNPLHNGHLYHIARTRENGASHIIAVMSGNFVQRGETALMEKHLRASLALKGGADLVVEIPAVYSLASAEYYASAAVHILDSLGCTDELSFGSECGDISILSRAAEIIQNIPPEKTAGKMKLGMTYPAAVADIIGEKYSDISDVISHPNNILGIEYIRAIRKLNSDIKPFTVRRYGAEHDSPNTAGSFSSASNIRKLMAENKDFSGFIPDCTMEAYRITSAEGKLSDMKNLERIILYKLRTSSLSELAELPDVGQGLEYRLKQAADSGTVSKLLEKVKTKRYTMARLKRILMNMIIGITNDDLKKPPAYAHILALNERGREILARRGNNSFPFFTSLSKLSETGPDAERLAFTEGTASDIYGLSQNNPGSRNDDYRASVRIEKNEN